MRPMQICKTVPLSPAAVLMIGHALEHDGRHAAAVHSHMGGKNPSLSAAVRAFALFSFCHAA